MSTPFDDGTPPAAYPDNAMSDSSLDAVLAAASGTQAQLPLLQALLASGMRRYSNTSDGAGHLILGCGLSGTSSALAMAATMTGAAFLGFDEDASALKSLLRTGFLDFVVNSLDESLRMLKLSIRKGDNISVGVTGKPEVFLAECVERGLLPALIVDFTERGGYANSLAAMRQQGSILLTPETPVNEYLSGFLVDGRAPLTFVSLAGARATILQLEAVVRDLATADAFVTGWLDLAHSRLRFQGLPARTLWLTTAERQVLASRLVEFTQLAIVRPEVSLSIEKNPVAKATAPEFPLALWLDICSSSRLSRIFVIEAAPDLDQQLCDFLS